MARQSSSAAWPPGPSPTGTQRRQAEAEKTVSSESPVLDSDGMSINFEIQGWNGPIEWEYDFRYGCTCRQCQCSIRQAGRVDLQTIVGPLGSDRQRRAGSFAVP